jgi:hypothetical protein
MKIRDRIKEFRQVPAARLQPNPKNWRTHLQAQQDDPDLVEVVNAWPTLPGPRDSGIPVTRLSQRQSCIGTSPGLRRERRCRALVYKTRTIWKGKAKSGKYLASKCADSADCDSQIEICVG